MSGTVKLPRVERLRLEGIRPYPGNPRRITDEAVSALEESIQRYGYHQPIVVDANHVIIIGHTRYLALRKLHWTEVTVQVIDYLTPTQVQELRLIDNRSAEFTDWDLDKLIGELAFADSALIANLFRDILPETDELTADPDIEGGSSSLGQLRGENDAGSKKPAGREVELECPACHHGWATTVTAKEIKARRIDAAV